MKFNKKNKNKGFTLIEILIVIGIIAVLAAIVLVAINPARQFRQANNSQRTANVNAILNAIGQYVVDNKGALPPDMPADGAAAEEIRMTAFEDFCDALVPEYIPALPADPTEDDQSITEDECDNAGLGTSYEVEVNDGRVTVSAPETEDLSPDEPVDEISVTR